MELIAVLLLLLLVLFGEIALYQHKGLDGLSYRCDFQETELTEGETLTWTETVENAKALPVPWLKAEITVPSWLYVPEQHSTVTGESRFITSFFSLRGNASVSRVWTLRCDKRGVYQVEHVVLVTSDLLGAVSLSLPAADTGRTVRVLPRRFTEAGLLLPKLLRHQFGEHPVRYSLQKDPCLSAGVRPYVWGDTLSRMHWKASAHAGTLLMRQEEHTAQQEICVLLALETNHAASGNVTEDSTLMEHTIRVCAQCLYELCQNGWMVQLFVGEETEDRRAYATPVGGGSGMYHRLAQFLAELSLTHTMPLSHLVTYGTSGRTTLLITPHTDKQTAEWKRQRGALVLVTGHAHDLGVCADLTVCQPERG